MPRSRLHIAIVDDEIAVRTALEHVFRSAEIGVTTFGSGEEFLTSLKSNRPDCAVVDLHMPGLTGWDVLRRLRSIRPSMPVVVITGKDEPGLQERVLAAGAAEYFVKPLDDEILLGAVEAAANSSNQQHARSAPAARTGPANSDLASK